MVFYAVVEITASLLAVDRGGDSGGLRCSCGHFVNIAKEGHIHLLPPQRRAPAKDAEADARTRAERAFYEGGGFQAQAEGLADEVLRALGSRSPRNPLHVDVTECGRHRVSEESFRYER